MMGRIIFLAVFGVLLTLGLHIALLLTLPFAQPDRLWQDLVAQSDPHQFYPVNDLPRRDPLMLEVFCRFTLGQDPISINVPIAPLEAYWALSLFDRSASLFFTMSDSSAPTGQPALLIVMEAGAEVEEQDEALTLELPPGDYFATFKTFAATKERRTSAERLALSGQCAPVQLAPEPVYEPRLKPGDLPTPLPKPAKL